MKINIGINDQNRAGVIAILSHVLSDEYVLYTKTRNFHWNVTGADFSQLHKFFESQYDEIDAIIDEVAERARSLGGQSLGSLKEFLSHTRLTETPGAHLESKWMLSGLLADHESLVQSLRTDVAECTEKFQDAGTSDFLTGIMEQHEKMAWMLRSYLE